MIESPLGAAWLVPEARATVERLTAAGWRTAASEGDAGDKHGGPGEADHSYLDVVREQLDRQRVRAPALSLRGQGVGIRCAAFDPLGELTFGAKVLQVDT